jgi:hypothetical protein
MDETGILQEGQMFLQIESYHQKRVISGSGCVLRNPHPFPHGVRLVTLVDIPELHHLTNCAVFSRKGSIPLPYQCSSGDLDGDQYIIIWDRDFVPTTQLEPFLPPIPERERKETKLHALIQHFYACSSNDYSLLKLYGSIIKYLVAGNLVHLAIEYAATLELLLNLSTKGSNLNLERGFINEGLRMKLYNNPKLRTLDDHENFDSWLDTLYSTHRVI